MTQNEQTELKAKLRILTEAGKWAAMALEIINEGDDSVWESFSLKSATVNAFTYAVDATKDCQDLLD